MLRPAMARYIWIRLGAMETCRPGNGGNPVANVTQPTWMSMDRSGKWLFIASSAAGGVQEFQIDAASGALRPVSQSPALIRESDGSLLESR